MASVLQSDDRHAERERTHTGAGLRMHGWPTTDLLTTHRLRTSKGSLPVGDRQSEFDSPLRTATMTAESNIDAHQVKGEQRCRTTPDVAPRGSQH